MSKNHRVEIVVDGKDNSRPAISQAKQGIKSISVQLARLQKLVIGWKGFTGVIQSGQAFVNLAEDIQLSNSRLAVSVGNMQKAAQAQKEIAILAQETGGGYVALSQLYGRVALSAEQYNLSQKTLADLTRVTAQSLRLSGATAQESASATLQLSQALGAGTLRSEEFRAVIVAETFLSTIIFIVFIKP